MKILSENQIAQLEAIGYVSVDDLRRMLQDVDFSEVDEIALHKELERRGIKILEVAPPNLPRTPQNSEATPPLGTDVDDSNEKL